MTTRQNDSQHGGTLVPYDLHRLYTAEEYLRLSEDDSFSYELQDGVIYLGPRPGLHHQVVSGQLYIQLSRQLPAELVTVQRIDIDLELPTPTVRAPDLVVLQSSALQQPIVKASDVVLAVEILSPGSVYLDTTIKPLEYTNAGIPNLWVLDPDPPVTATAYRLHGELYEESHQAEHTVIVDKPCPLTIDLDTLLPAD